MRILLWLVSLVCCLGALGSGFNVETYPDPVTQFEKCGRVQSGFVCDPDRVIDPKAADQIQSIINTLQNEDIAGCSSGGTQLGVALMNKFHIPREEDAPTAARHFAKDLHDKWGVGHVDCNNGILFLLSKTDRQIYISTGPGISHRLTDDDIHVIISNMKEGLRAGQFSDTIVSAVDEIRAVLLENKRAVVKRDYSSFKILGGLSIVIFLLYQCSKRTPYSKCSRKLSLIERQAKAQKFDHSSCPICLEEFPENIIQSHSHSQQTTTTPTTSTTTSTSTNQKEVEILDCGHTFCKECIEEWFSSRRSEVCPICRAGEPSAPSKVPQSAEEEVFQNELRFRLLSLNRHYPTYVTTTMVDDWTRTNRNYNFHSSYTAFHNPPSSSGSGSSWGGGYSGGGGGGGGSW
eukprot:TRINITY_DN111_c0_g1_i1.p1 TRINITY_DN111_c0_g1~~TRINITY_DN111_c0_g1_i1.p1  ORF type:complete len:404 (+),score=78.85 TRINITY_DN111_c0_g1_i1:681-1892(+)